MVISQCKVVGFFLDSRIKTYKKWKKFYLSMEHTGQCMSFLSTKLTRHKWCAWAPSSQGMHELPKHEAYRERMKKSFLEHRVHRVMHEFPKHEAYVAWMMCMSMELTGKCMKRVLTMRRYLTKRECYGSKMGVLTIRRWLTHVGGD